MSNTVDTSHKSILKTTGLFGLVQVIKIVLGIFSVKIVAVYLGVSGVGKLGYLQSIINIVAAVSSFGLQTILVREISLLKDKPDFLKKLNLLHNWSLYVGVFGFLIFFITLPFLENGIFDKMPFYWIILLALQFIFLSLGNFKTAYLQGTHQVRKFAKVQIVNSIIISILGMVLYFCFGTNAIVSVLFLTSFVGFLINSFYVKEVALIPKYQSVLHTFNETKGILKAGFLLSINVIFGYLCTFIIKNYLKGLNGGIELIGFYEVAVTIMITYVGLVFSAMGSDFYPKLTSIVHKKEDAHKLINNQIQVALFLVLPVVIGVLAFGNYLIPILYTNKFLPVLSILQIGLFSVVIKAITWPIGFYLLALKENKQYFFQELIADFLNVTLSILFYNLYGLIGLGFAMAVNFIVYFWIVKIFILKSYNFKFNSSTIKIIVLSVLNVFFAIYLCLSNNNVWILYLQFLLISFFYLIMIQKYLNLNLLIKRLLTKF